MKLKAWRLMLVAVGVWFATPQLALSCILSKSCPEHPTHNPPAQHLTEVFPSQLLGFMPAPRAEPTQFQPRTHIAPKHCDLVLSESPPDDDDQPDDDSTDSSTVHLAFSEGCDCPRDWHLTRPDAQSPAPFIPSINKPPP